MRFPGKPFTFWTLSFLVSVLAARADTTFVVSGPVSGSWTSAGSPYVVQGNLSVAASDSLLVGSGVRIYFAGAFSLTVNGYLAVSGTLGDSAVFTTDTLLNPSKWRGLSLINANDSSFVRYAVFENSLAPGPTGPDSLGGAIYVGGGSVLRVEHTSFRRNRAEVAGGAVYVTSSTLWMDSCFFERNVSRAEGAGLFLNNTIGSVVTYSRFFKNSASSGSGGGAYLRGGSPQLSHCLFDSNFARINGGGLVFKNSTGRIDSSTMRANQGRGHGGGIVCENSSPLIYDCLIERNYTIEFDGGGVYIWESSPHMLRCKVLMNTSADDGGGIHSYRATSNGLFEECEVRGNICVGEGAGIWVTLDGAPTFNNCVVKQNTAGLYGGGVFLRNNAHPIFTNCDFDSNTSLGNGGGLSIRQSQPTLNGCRVRWNQASDEGGGVHLWETADAVFNSCEILKNTSTLNGGGISTNQSTLSATNCLITKNKSLALGGGLATANSSKIALRHCTIGGSINGGLRLESTVADIENSIIAESTSNNVYFGASKNSRIAYSLLRGTIGYLENDAAQGPEFIGVPVAQNMNGDSCDTFLNVFSDPMFADTANGDWSLSANSSAIGSGNWNTLAQDIVGENRPLPLLSLPDMGAIESAFGVSPVGIFGPQSGTLGPDTVKVFADIVVNTGEDLTIAAGTTLLFCGPCGMDVKGVVTAIGNVSDSILFATDTVSNPGRWRGITMSGSAGASAFDYVGWSDSWALTTSRTQGGAIWLSGVSPSFVHCSISRHKALQGGAVYLTQSSPVFTECFLSSSSADSGGIVCAATNSNPIIDDCVMAGGSAKAGGALLAKSATGQILNSRIEGNSASATGGGIHLDTSPTLVRNNLLLNNSAPAGGAIWVGSASATLQFNTISGNSGVDGAGVYIRFGSPQVKNNIIAKNHGDGMFFFVTSTSVVRYNCVAQNDSANFAFFADTPNQGPASIGILDSLNSNSDPCDRYYNIQLDPQWVSGSGHGFYLAQLSTGDSVQSPCVNAGDTLLIAPEGTTRIDFIADISRPDQGYHGPQLGEPLAPIEDLMIRANSDSVWLHWSYNVPALFTVKTDSSMSGSFLSTVVITTDTFTVFQFIGPVHPVKGFFQVLAEPQP